MLKACVTGMQKCGVRDHRCLAIVQLQAMQEVWGIFNLEDSDGNSSTDDQPDQQLLSAISVDAILGQAGPKTLQLHGQLQGRDVLILIDSGSTNSFISSSLAAQLPEPPIQTVDVRVRVANGAVMQSSAVLPDCSWLMQGYSFSQDLKVLSLQSYDIVLGMDWLEKFSPMKVYWGNKWMIKPHQGTSVLLQGITPSCPEELVI